jgi:hypothetical protein
MPVSILYPCINTCSELLGIALDFTGRESAMQLWSVYQAASPIESRWVYLISL